MVRYFEIVEYSKVIHSAEDIKEGCTLEEGARRLITYYEDLESAMQSLMMNFKTSLIIKFSARLYRVIEYALEEVEYDDDGCFNEIIDIKGDISKMPCNIEGGYNE